MLDERENFSLEEMDKQSLFHPLTSIANHMKNGPLIVEQGHGVRIKDHKGRDMIDCGAGLWCVNVGYGRPEIAEAAKTAILNLNYYHIFGSASTEPIIRLADKVLTLLREQAGATHLARVFFGCSGSDANDTNVKLVRYYNNLLGRPQKEEDHCARRRLPWPDHGRGEPDRHQGLPQGMGPAAAGRAAHQLPALVPVRETGRERGRVLRSHDRRAGSDHRARGAGDHRGVHRRADHGHRRRAAAARGLFPRVQEILQKHDILFIADEVITGFGRTGQWFATGLYDLKPDIVTLAKGITSAYFPLSASVISKKIWDVLESASAEHGPVMHGFTYSGHPVGGAIGLANLEIMEREGLIDNAAKVGPYLLNQLRETVGDHPYIGDVRGEGLIMALEFIADRETRRPFDPKAGVHRLVAARAMELQLMVRPLPFIETIPFSPPLCITAAECDEAVERFRRPSMT